MERKEEGVCRKRPGGEARRRRRNRERIGSGGRESGLQRRRERKWPEVKAGSRRRSGGGAVAGSGAGWNGRARATSEAATIRGSASVVDGECDGGGCGGGAYHGREEGGGGCCRGRRALRIVYGGVGSEGVASESGGIARFNGWRIH